MIAQCLSTGTEPPPKIRGKKKTMKEKKAEKDKEEVMSYLQSPAGMQRLVREIGRKDGVKITDVTVIPPRRRQFIKVSPAITGCTV